MKRRPIVSPAGPPKKQPRQDPVSCESCRKKKLKCDRSQPCSSCFARRLQCSYEASRPEPARLVIKPANHTADEAASHDRIAPRPRQPTKNVESNGRVRRADDSTSTAHWLETIVMGHRVPNAVPALFRHELSRHQRIESPQSNTNALPGGNLLALIQGRLIPSYENPSAIHLPSFLPTKSEVMGLLEYYYHHLDYQYHLIILHRTKQDIDNLYTCIARGEPVNLNHMALLFSVVAAALFFQLLSTESAELAEACSRETVFLTGAALIQSNQAAYPSIEGLQASMIIGHHLSSLNLSPSVSFLFLHGALITQGKGLGLQTMDCPRFNDGRKMAENNRTDMELKRRLWWDLASYDWLIGFLSGPQEITYSINPRHMNVRKPLNIEDEDIETSETGLPLSTPTCMSYTLHRIRLAEVCREIVDEMAPEYFHGREVPYEKILDLDRRLHSAYNETPPFFRFDHSSRRKYADLYRERPQIAWQRANMQQGYHSRVCRLHREYFVRGAKDPRYSYSHVVSLQSARKILEIKRIMDEEEPKFTPNSSFFWTVMNHVFVAAVTLLIDVCFNWDDILADKRKEEVIDACRMLSRAQQSSSIAREGINAMMEILRKYFKQEKRTVSGGRQPEPPSVTGLYNPNSDERQPMSEVDQIQGDQNVHSAHQNQALSAPESLISPMPLEDVWTEMLDGSAHVGLDTPDWMDLLTELTHTTVPCE
ncbi:uncharacterized protein N7459_000830 [Penicillium hispanicum]|uniref:uncharacterized protein n=1 Tax=Penicillium hispanicum TaxID=1080232 RepID=UPI0025416787|nr:uncharacterized protein N7459_000830 [Penicillium hispanicum]KAJ5594622.1 hypothetical protein N7459_000830 [Penicillium hispanicum]